VTTTVERALVVGLIGALAAGQALGAPESGTPLTPGPAAEVVLGNESLQRFLASRPLAQDGALAMRVNRVGYQLARVSDRPDLVYSFLVVAGRELQAYSFNGGAVCLTERLARLFDSDDELAFAIGHELAHVTLRHGVSEGVFHQALDAAKPGDPAAAASLYTQTAEIEADRYGALYACRAGFRISAAAEALERMDRAEPGLDKDPEHPAYSERMATLGKMRAELERSVEAFERGSTALAAGRVDEAVDMLKLFAASFPQSVSGQVNLGSAFLARARTKGQVPGDLEEIVPFLPEPGVAVRGEGAGESAAIDARRAEERYRRALTLQPDQTVATLGLALALLRLGDYAGAQASVQRLASRGVKDPEVVLCSGNVSFAAGDTRAAVQQFRKALELRPGWPAATKNLALALEAAGDRESARALWQSIEQDDRLGQDARRHLDRP